MLAHLTFRRLGVLVVLLATSPPVLAQKPSRELGEKYALLVGVRQYDKNELRGLKYTETDVESLAAVLVANGYRRENVVLMTQKHGAEESRFLPTSDRIRLELRRLLENRGEKDALLIALSGHGVQFAKEESHYFCPMDARLADRQTLIGLTEVYDALKTCPASVKLLLVDACRNDPQAENSKSGGVVAVESVTRPQRVAPPGGVAALFSCSAQEQAFEHDQLKRGVFFHFVVQGLRGEADLDRDRAVDLPELEKYVKKRVSDFVRGEYGRRQMPTLVGETRGLVSLVNLPPPQQPVPPPRAQGPRLDQVRAGLLALENAILFEAVADAWRERRPGWVEEVGKADVGRLAALLYELECSVKWDAVVEAWRGVRPAWVQGCDQAASTIDVAELMILLEIAVTWDAVSPNWKDQRGAWLESLR